MPVPPPTLPSGTRPPRAESIAIRASSAVTCWPEISLSPPSQVSATTGSDQSQSGWCFTVHWMVP